MLTIEEFGISLSVLSDMDLIKSFNKVSPTNFTYKMYVNIKENTLTQDIIVTLVDDTHVMAYSHVGPCPQDADTLQSLLVENMDGCYSRLAVVDGDLVQVYRYPLEFLDTWVLFKALDETSQLANYARRQYFGEADMTL